MSFVTIILFFITAILYAMVGFGGGSTYNALLVLADTDYRLLPTIALTCNIIVVTGGVWRFSQAGHVSMRHALPFIVTSIPAAWIGGRIPVSEVFFVGLLGLTLFLSGAHLFVTSLRQPTEAADTTRPIRLPVAALTGGLIGFVSGLVGIGGGIFLAPVLYFLRWGKPQQIAAICSLFILVNSLAGLGGQISKLHDLSLLNNVVSYWPLALAVLIGGQIGSWLGAIRLQSRWVKFLTSLLILFVAVRLLIRWSGMM